MLPSPEEQDNHPSSGCPLKSSGSRRPGRAWSHAPLPRWVSFWGSWAETETEDDNELPETSSSSSAADSLERLRRWGSEESVNGYYLQRTYRHESATAARCALWGSARPYARYAGGSRQSCVLWQVNGFYPVRAAARAVASPPALTIGYEA